MIPSDVQTLDPLLAPLNEQQRAVVMAPVGKARMVLAGPGSGKTRTLVHRVARLMRDGVPPERILLVTFTNKAAREMMQRCEQLCGSMGWRVQGGTFHGLGAKILRKFGSALGLDPEFRILDSGDTEEHLRAAVTDLGLDIRRDSLPRTRTMARIFSMAAQREMSLEQALLQSWPQHHHNLAQISAVAAQFVRRKQEASHVDFNDLLVGWSLLADPPPEADAALLAASQALQSQFIEVLVDEYQDTNAIQGRIADAMARGNGGLTVVGDDCQGIYGFRGADANNLLAFDERFEAAERQLLTLNYRSTPEILKLANLSIGHNQGRLKKELIATRKSLGLPPFVVRLEDRSEEAQFVVARVAQLRAEEGVAYASMAVLYRSHALSSELQLQLTKAGIPFVLRSGVRFFEQAHIKDVFAFFRAALGDDLALRRVLLLFPGLGQRSADAAIKRLLNASVSLRSLSVDASGSGRRGLAQASQLLAGLIDRQSEALAEQMAYIVDLYKENFLQRFDDALERGEDLEELVRFSEGFPDIATLLADLPVSDMSSMKAQDRDSLILSSIHQAKGLEWKRVFLIGMVEGNLPHAASFADAHGLDEERRLFYVAVTRAEDELYLCYAQRGGRGRLQTPSRFLGELMIGDQPPFQMVRPSFG